MRGILKGEENANRFRCYLEALRTQGLGLPARDGKSNLSIIADACGFDRGVFYANQTAKMLLDEAIGQLGLDDGRPRPDTAFEEARLREEAKARSDGRSKALEEEVLRLRAENARLKIENERLRAIRALMSETGRMP